jgi:NADH-quinone oxidoreductase subunit M
MAERTDDAALGVDALSLPLVVLTTVLFAVGLLASGRIRSWTRWYHAWVLALESAVLGVFLARNWVVFYASWELTLVPFFFLISVWGGERRSQAAMTMLLYALGGSVFLLTGLLSLYWILPGHGFVLDRVAELGPTLPPEVQAGLLLAFLIGFGVKLPIVPLHGWLPLVYRESPAPLPILSSGVLLKLGAYGLLRMTMALPEGARLLSTLLFGLGLVGVVHGALLAWRQRDLRQIVAWSSVSHMGFVVIGIAAGNALGQTGALLQMVAHGLVVGLLFLVVAVLDERAHDRDVRSYGGLVGTDPEIGLLVVIALLASIAVPATPGFPAELSILAGAWSRFGPWVALVPLAALAWAAVAVRTLLGVVGGPPGAATKEVTPLDPAEATAGFGLVALLLLLGLFPGLVGAPASTGTETAAASPSTTVVAEASDVAR